MTYPRREGWGPSGYPGVVSVSIEPEIVHDLFVRTLSKVHRYDIDIELVNGKRIRASIPSILVDPPTEPEASWFEWAAPLVFTEWDWQVARMEHSDLNLPSVRSWPASPA